MFQPQRATCIVARDHYRQHSSWITVDGIFFPPYDSDRRPKTAINALLYTTQQCMQYYYRGYRFGLAWSFPELGLANDQSIVPFHKQQPTAYRILKLCVVRGEERRQQNWFSVVGTNRKHICLSSHTSHNFDVPASKCGGQTAVKSVVFQTMRPSVYVP